LDKVAKALKGKTADIEVKPLSGTFKWYKVDQTQSPLCQNTLELIVSPGGFAYNPDKFYIPGASWNVKWVKFGVFVEPNVSLDLNAIHVVRDGSKNPMKWGPVSGGATLSGDISGGFGLTAFDPKKVITIDADVRGTAAASGGFELELPGPTFSGEYTFGQLTVSGQITIEYRTRPVFTKKVSKEVWEGITDEAEIDFSKLFNK